MSSQIEITKEIIKYINHYGYQKDPVVKNLVNETKKLGNVSRMQISPEQGKFLELIVKITNAKKCLEIGRFTGLSTLCIARGLSKNGKIIAIDNSKEFLPTAQKFWKIAKVEKKIKSIIGEGKDILQKYVKKNLIFYLIFIDADKKNYNLYYELSIKLISKNGLIIIDNMLWGGRVVNKKNKDKTSKKIDDLNKKILKDKRIEFLLLPLADGLSLIKKK